MTSRGSMRQRRASARALGASVLGARVLGARVLGLPLAGLLLLAAAQAQEAPAPVETPGQAQQGDNPPGEAPARPAKGSVEQRLDRVERLVENRSLLELAQSVSALREEVRRLRGQLDQQQHQFNQLQQRQQEIYEDLDRRVQVLSKIGALTIDPDGEAAVDGSAEDAADGGGINGALPAPAGTGLADTASPGAADPEGQAAQGAETEAPEATAALEADPLRIASEYDQAFSEMRSGNYRRALSSFSRWLENYPEAPQRANALFWKAELLFIQQDYADAVASYQALLQNYPNNHKREQALLKMGFSEDALGNSAKAIEILENALRSFPGSASAQLAQKRLDEIRSRAGTR